MKHNRNPCPQTINVSFLKKGRLQPGLRTCGFEIRELSSVRGSILWRGIVAVNLVVTTALVLNVPVESEGTYHSHSTQSEFSNSIVLNMI